jgi:hypothetical protein
MELPGKARTRKIKACTWISAVAVLSTATWLSGAHATTQQKDGVTLSVEALADRAVFCISASGDLQISSEYGIEFKAANGKPWNEALPKVVTGKPYYFDLPLRIELRTRGRPQQRSIAVNLGACSHAAGTCTPITFDITVPAADPKATASSCAAQP